jgi:precorrin-6y C5,15-methyltransferase (decarboxylating) CbiE subunit
VTEAARRAARAADVLAGPTQLLQLFPDSQARRSLLGPRAEQALETIDGLEGTVAVLVSGDPGLYSLARSMAERFGPRCEVIPGISSVQVAFARLGRSWAGARIVSAHATVPEVAPESLVREEAVVILGGNRRASPWIQELARALAASHLGYLAEDLTLPTERLVPFEQNTRVRPEARALFLFLRKERIT